MGSDWPTICFLLPSLDSRARSRSEISAPSVGVCAHSLFMHSRCSVTCFLSFGACAPLASTCWNILLFKCAETLNHPRCSPYGKRTPPTFFTVRHYRGPGPHARLPLCRRGGVWPRLLRSPPGLRKAICERVAGEGVFRTSPDLLSSRAAYSNIWVPVTRNTLVSVSLLGRTRTHPFPL